MPTLRSLLSRAIAAFFQRRVALSHDERIYRTTVTRITRAASEQR